VRMHAAFSSAATCARVKSRSQSSII
jgi:hypothetical protein